MYGTACAKVTGTWTQCGSGVKGSEDVAKGPKHGSRLPKVVEGLQRSLISFVSIRIHFDDVHGHRKACEWMSSMLWGQRRGLHECVGCWTYLDVSE